MAGATTVTYFLVVISTTPNLPPFASLSAAFAINSIIIIGTSVGVGVQVFISSYSKSMDCKLTKTKNGIFGAGSGCTAVSSFFSFFSIIPLGCCGTWLLVLSYLPSVFGSTLSVVIVRYSRPLSYIGLALIFGFVAISAFKLRKELMQRKGVLNIQGSSTNEG